ncbi:MAG: hypothetical protein ACM3WS_02025 [Bacillota bacterium]
MKDIAQQPGASDDKLDRIVDLAENAADIIKNLRAELSRCEQRIKQLEQSEAQLRQAAQRYLRMKAQLEGQSEAKGGFAANGTVYPTFDEAFDAAYPGALPG